MEQRHVHWLHCPPGFNALRTWLARLRASENIDFICDVMRFKKVEDIASTKEMASRIHAKYIVEGAVAQVCLPSPMISLIAEGLLPKFPSEALFDGAVEHVIAFMQQDVWHTFKQSPEFAEHEMMVSNELRLGGPKLLLSIRLPGGAIRHVTHIHKKMITIGATFDCDVVVKENRLAGTRRTATCTTSSASGSRCQGQTVRGAAVELHPQSTLLASNRIELLGSAASVSHQVLSCTHHCEAYSSCDPLRRDFHPQRQL